MKRVYGYCRVSTEQQDTKRQIELVSNHCELNNYKLIDIIQEKVSGSKSDRKSINDLLLLDNTVCDMIIVSELSRISREKDVLKVLNTINEILQNGLDVIFLDEPNKLYKAGKELDLYDIITLSVKAQGAAEEKEKIKLRMKTGKITKVNNYPYAYVGGIVPYGFKLTDNIVTNKNEPKQIIVTDEETINNVKIIFNSVINGKTLRDTAKYINELGLRTINGLNFNLNGIRIIIRNRIYVGERPLKDKYYSIDCNIITIEEFDLANKRLQDNQIFKNKGVKHFNPLKGILKCACRQSMLMRIFNTKKHSNYIFYGCMSKARRLQEVHLCENNGVDGNILIQSVWKVVKATLKLEEYSNTNNRIIKEKESDISLLNDKIDSINSSVEKNIIEMDNIEINLTMVTNQTLIKKLEKRYSELLEINEILNVNKEKIRNEIKEIKNKVDYLSTIIIDEEISNEEKARIFRNVLERVTYYSDKKFKGFVLVKFKNGIENVIAVRTGKYGYSAQLPYTFSFDKENRKVILNNYYTNPQEPFALPIPIKKYYTFDELQKKFDLKEYKLILDN